jgi:pyruvate/2-oxoglutarate dehydrogenase complex dihydrolipoamide dehydrogenase (E3) component
MQRLLKPDICVIGAGSGGLTVAAAAAAFGVSVVLVERGRMGGDCLNHGCVPSKALIASAKLAKRMREASAFGLGTVEPDIDFAAVNRHVQGVIEAIAPNDSVERFTALGVRVIQAEARFADKRTVLAGETEIKARRFVIAAGSSPQVPPIPGLEDVPFLTNETIFERKRLTRRLIIVGGGPVGLEMAQAHRRLGAEVTVLEAGEILAREDRELVALVRRRLVAEGVDIREGTKLARVEKRGNVVRAHLDQAGESVFVDGSHLLLATGRKANVDSLGLEAAGIRFSPSGITVDPRLRTSNRRVYAIGDITGGAQFTHVASFHAGIVLRAILFRLRARADRTVIPRVTFTDPEIAHVGLIETEARASHRHVRVLRWPYAENDRAQTERQTEGHIKLVTDRRGRVLGASIAGANAGEQIALWSLVVAKGMRVHDLAALVLPYPTMSEIGKRASVTYFSEATARPIVRRIIRFLRIFG